MGILVDDTVVIKRTEKEGEPVVVTVNCPDKTGLGCDLCRVILLFGLNVVRADASTDGKWCYLVFWVIGKPSARWSLLKKRLMEVCPSCTLASSISYFRDELLQNPRTPQLFLLKLCSYGRHNLLHVQSDGKKLLDQGKQSSLCCRLQLELSRPLRVTLISQGPVTQLLVANPVELSGKGRPNVFYDMTRALKVLNRPIFLAEISRYMIRGREWEVYTMLLDEAEWDDALKKKIEDMVWRRLVFWE